MLSGFTRYIDEFNIGGPGETPIVGDFNADGYEDIAVYIPDSTGARWAVNKNDRNGTIGGRIYDQHTIGGPGEIPIVGDFNGDGYDDIGVYIPNGTTNARWAINLNNRNGTFGGRYIDQYTIGGAGETPVVGDFDGDGYDDIGVYIPWGTHGNAARWAINLNNRNGTLGGRYIDTMEIGGIGELPFVGDFDHDGLDDIGIHIPSTRRWVVETTPSGGGVEYIGGTMYVPSGETVNNDGVIHSGTTLIIESQAEWVGNLDVKDSTVENNGKHTGTVTAENSTFTGDGRYVGQLNMETSLVSPGEGPGVLTVGGIDFGQGSTLEIELFGSTVGSEYDQLRVNGTVDLSNANLIVTLGFSPALGQEFVIVDNDGSDAVIGTFSGLAEGASLTIGGKRFHITYRGGDGNDVVLRRNLAPVADAGPDQTENEGTVVAFTASGSVDGDGDPLTYLWDFGDGQSGTGVAPTHLHGDDGVYVVTLTVDDGTGDTGTDSLVVTVNNVAPTIVLDPVTPIDENGIVTLSGSVSDPGYYQNVVDNLDIVDRMIAGTLPSTTATAQIDQADINDNVPGNWGFDNPVPGGGGDDYAIRGTGTLQVNTAGWFSFALSGDDGGRLRIDGNDVILDDTLHPFEHRYGSADLTAGAHTFEWVGFERGGGAAWELSVGLGNGKGWPVDSANGWQVVGDPSPFAEIQLSGQIGVTAYYLTRSSETWEPLTVTVDWKDGSSNVYELANGANSFQAVHRYSDDGPNPGTSGSYGYNIDVTVTDDDGGVGTDNTTVTVNNVAPVIDDLVVAPSVIDEGSSVTLSAHFIDPGVLDTHTAVVDWGDGTSETVTTYTDGVSTEAAGTILAEYWTGIGGTAVSNLTDSPNYPNSPNGIEQLTSFESPTNWADNYGARVRGYVHAPVTGNYEFWIASDDASELLLSTDDDPVNSQTIASVLGWTFSRQWGKYASQHSVPIHLEAGQRYYIEAVQKEGGGGDNLAVRWMLPGGTWEDPGDPSTPIPGNRLSPFGALPTGHFIDTLTHTYLDDNPTGTASDDYTITMTVTDDDGGSDSASTTITVNNVAPVAADYDVITDEDNPAAPFNVLNDLTDMGIEDTHTAVSASFTTTKGGEVTISADKAIYDPSDEFEYLAVGQSTTDSFDYTVTDDDGGADTATVTVTITGVNDAPVAADDSTVTNEDLAVTVDVLANDTDVDQGSVLSVESTTDGAHGTVTTDGLSVTYTPNSDYFGSDSFEYTVRDEHGATSTATVAVTVTPVNDAPTANADAATVAEDGSVVIAVLTNDSKGPANESGQTLTVTSASALHGTVTTDGTTLTYSPDADYNGLDTISYAITDNGTTNGVADPLTSSSTVAVTVTPVNDAPTADAQTVSVTEDGSVLITLSGSDVETAETHLTFTVTSLPTGGILKDSSSNAVAVGDTFTGPPTLTYEKGISCEGVGSDSFTFTVTDRGDPDNNPGDSALTSGPATVTINVVQAVADGAVTVEAGIVRIGGTSADDVIVVTHTADGQNLHVTVNGVVDDTIPMAGLTEIRAWGRAGNDHIELIDLALRSMLHGGDDDDELIGAHGSDLIFGGRGDDKLTGASGNDFLIGGAGSDRIVGSAGHDILVSGDLACSITEQALWAALADWVDGREDDDGTIDDILDETLITDGDFDKLTGSSGADLFIINDGDKITDLKKMLKDGDEIRIVG